MIRNGRGEPWPMVPLGRALGNWNDRRYGPSLGRRPNRARWERLNRVASWLYVRGEG